MQLTVLLCCMSLSVAYPQRLDLPSDKVVYAQWPAGTEKFLKAGDEYRLPQRPLFDHGWFPAPPADWHPPVFYRPAAVGWFTPKTKWDGLAFLDRLTASDGTSRTVLVITGCTAFGPRGHRLLLDALVFESPSLSLPRGKVATSCTFELGADDVVTIFAGQRDAAKKSDFSIRYVINGKEGALDARLMVPGEVQRRVAIRVDSRMREHWVAFRPRFGREPRVGVEPPAGYKW